MIISVDRVHSQSKTKKNFRKQLCRSFRWKHGGTWKICRGTTFTSSMFAESAELESQNHSYVVWRVLWRPAGSVLSQKGSARQGCPAEI